MIKRNKMKKNWLLALSSPLLVVPIVLTSCTKTEEETSVYKKDGLYSLNNNLGTKIQSAMQSGEMNNNFGFFGGNDLFNYDIYQNNAYRSYVDLFSDYMRYNGPYKLDSSPYQFDTASKRRTIGSRFVFDLSSKDQTLATIVNDYNGLVKDNNIKTSVLVVDSADINNLSTEGATTEFETNLKRFILNGTSQNKNKGMVIIQKHYKTNDSSFNNSVDLINSIIDKVVLSFADDADLFSRIGLVDVSKNTDNANFKSIGINSSNLLTPYGTLELLNIFVDSLYPKHTSIAEWTSSVDDIKADVINQTITKETSYLQTADSTKVTNFKNYLSNNSKLKWAFVGDSLTNGSYFTRGYSGLYEYFKWYLKHDWNRPDDLVVNMGIHSNQYSLEYSSQNYGYNFLGYAPDVVHLWMGINDIYYESTASKITNTYFSNYLNKTLTDLESVNKNAWIVVSTIPTPKSDTVTNEIKTAIGNANVAIKNFAKSNSKVILNDLASVVDKVLEIDPNYQSNIYASDLLHYQSTAYVTFAKNLLTVLGENFPDPPKSETEDESTTTTLNSRIETILDSVQGKN